ncbi:MAG: hypothetical protein ABJN05_08715 [Sulfitobacter dubius]
MSRRLESSKKRIELWLFCGRSNGLRATECMNSSFLDWLREIALAATRDELTSAACSLEAFGLVRLGQYDDNRVLEEHVDLSLLPATDAVDRGAHT